MVDVDLRQLRSFLVVAEELNITKAAARLHLAQQAVSVHMRQLERTVGADLLVRTSRGVVLTAAGQTLAAGGTRVLDDLDAVVEQARAVARGEAGRLRVVSKAHATTAVAMRAIAATERTVPGVRLELITVADLSEACAAITAGTADVGFVWLPVGDDRMQYAEVTSEARMVALPPGHRLAGRSSVTLADLADDPVVGPFSLVAPEVARHWLAEPRPDGRPAVRGPEARTSDECLLHVVRGHGVWLAPESVARHYTTLRLCWATITDAEPARLALMWLPHAPIPLIARFIAEVRRLFTHETISRGGGQAG